MSAIERAVENWQRNGLDLLPPNAEASVIAALDATGRTYSRDLVTLYSATGGMVDGETDSSHWSLWPLDRVVAETSRYERPGILFADFLIDSHLYCFKYEDAERSSVWIDYFNGEEPVQVASSVEAFFEIYLSDPGSLEMFGSI